MTLVDSVGDMIRKARQISSVSLEAAAAAANVTPAELEELERSGKIPNQSRLNVGRLASLVGLHPQKMERIANGWLPAPRDLGLWRELRLITTTRDKLPVNCFLVWDEISREAALFDTGWEAAPIFELIEQNGLQLKHLFLTHTHEDHMAAMGALRERFPQLRLHTNSKSAPPQHRNRANDFIHLGSLRISNRDVPGHAEDGVIYVIGNWPEDVPHVAVVGDTIFAGSIATNHGPAGLLRLKISEQILSLPAETILCPGHGVLTTVGEEKSHNPFFA